eukprot:5065301-Prymnesium_polylepis.2
MCSVVHVRPFTASALGSPWSRVRSSLARARDGARAFRVRHAVPSSRHPPNAQLLDAMDEDEVRPHLAADVCRCVPMCADVCRCVPVC